MNKTIKIYGAGISGLVAAINLAESGFKVKVMEARKQIGGHPGWHPSVHMQNFDLLKTSAYIGVDIRPCFRQIKKRIYYFYENKRMLESPLNCYVCEKGPGSASVENYLYSKAVKLGIEFAFNVSFDLKNARIGGSAGPGCILASGLEIEPYHLLGIPYVRIDGMRASKTSDQEDVGISCYGNYTNNEFAYLASFGSFMFCLMFTRMNIKNKDTETFKRRLAETENIEFNNWAAYSGCVPLEKNLVKNGIVLAGAIGGMIDPFYLNGISAALISGKIAAQFFVDREKAGKEFSCFTRNFYVKRNLKFISDFLPVKRYSFPVAAGLNNKLKWVGVI